MEIQNENKINWIEDKRKIKVVKIKKNEVINKIRIAEWQREEMMIKFLILLKPIGPICDSSTLDIPFIEIHKAC